MSVVTAPAAILSASCGGKIYSDDCVASQPSVPSCNGISNPKVQWQVSLSGNTSKCGSPTDPSFCTSVCLGPDGGGGPGGLQCTESGDVVTCTQSCFITGRAYDGLAREGAPSADSLGGFFAQMAYFEAASIHAFAILDQELLENGAPWSLRRSARAARRDEIQHAKMAEAVARELGAGRRRRPPRATRKARSLEAIAHENATEGCVGETYAAALAAWQSEHAPTPAMRAYFDRIAKDEARHAALARRVDAWIIQRLKPAARRRVTAARRAAWERLVASPPSSSAAVAVGLPDAEQAKRLAAALADALS